MATVSLANGTIAYYYDATSDAELELKVERLRDELAELGQAFKLWQNKVLNAFGVGLALLALIGGSVWWFGYSQHREIKGITAEARHITKEKSVPSCLSPSNALGKPPLPMRKRPRAGRNESAFAKPPRRLTPEESPALMSWPLPPPRSRVPPAPARSLMK